MITQYHSFHNAEAVMKLPRYFEMNGYKNPDDGYNSAYQLAFGTDLHCFDHMKTMPIEQQAFDTAVAVSRKWRGQDWFEVYPVEEKL